MLLPILFYVERTYRVMNPATWQANLVGDILLFLVLATIDDYSEIRLCYLSIVVESSIVAMTDYSNSL